MNVNDFDRRRLSGYKENLEANWNDLKQNLAGYGVIVPETFPPSDAIKQLQGSIDSFLVNPNEPTLSAMISKAQETRKISEKSLNEVNPDMLALFTAALDAGKNPEDLDDARHLLPTGRNGIEETCDSINALANFIARDAKRGASSPSGTRQNTR